MGTETERKFLVRGDGWRGQTSGVAYRQGYLAASKYRTVRVRLVPGKGYITVKGPTMGATRAEFEYEIPLEDAVVMIDTLCERPLIEKKRYTFAHRGTVWEVDEFEGDNNGLILAEVELQSEDQHVEMPGWIGREVTGIKRYHNASLISHPFCEWQEHERQD